MNIKSIALSLMVVVTITACRNKKLESTDQPAADTTQATTSSTPTLLAFDPIDHYTIKPGVELPDSINFFLPASQPDFIMTFAAAKGQEDKALSPDYVVNFTLGVVCPASYHASTIRIEKVELGDTSMTVYLLIEKNAAIDQPTTQLFAIERRSNLSRIDFVINGTPSKSIDLMVIPQ